MAQKDKMSTLLIYFPNLGSASYHSNLSQSRYVLNHNWFSDIPVNEFV